LFCRIEHEQVIGEPARHFDRVHRAAQGFVVAAEVVEIQMSQSKNASTPAL
jgi:hypothetical protein